MKLYFLAFLVVAICLQGASATPSASTPAPQLTTPSQAVALIQGQLGPAGQTWRPISTTTSYGTNFSDGYKTTAMTRYLDQVAGRAAVSAFEVCYSNFGGVAAGITTEADGLATLTITGSIEVNQTIVTGAWAATTTTVNLIPEYFKGSRTLTLSPGGFACSDPISYPLAASQNFYERTWVSASSGSKYPTTRDVLNTNYEGINNSSIQAATLSSSTTASTSISGTLTAGSTPIVLPLVPGSIFIYGGTITGYATDAGGTGTLTGTGVASGSTINYTTGAVTLNLTAAAVPNVLRAFGYGNSGVNSLDETLTTPITDLYSVVNPLSHGFAPTMVIGIGNSGAAVVPQAIGVFGDSIDFGSGNIPIGVSWVNDAANGAIGVVKEAQPSETACTFANPLYNRRRLSLATGLFDRAIENLGTNDMFGGTITLSALETCKLAVWAQLARLVPGGFSKVYAATLLPRTASASSQAPLNAYYGPGTVASGSPSFRNAFNAWLFTQVGVTIGGVIDTASCIEASPGSAAGAGSGQWLSLSDTLDGTHPSTVGNTLIGSCVGPGGPAASPVFAP